MLTIRSSDYVVSRDHIEEVIENAKEVHLDPDRQVLHTITQTFTVDDQPGIVKPEGMRCKMLSLNVMAVHGVKSRIENAVNVAKSAGLEVVDVAFSGVCAALAALTEQKRNGVVLIDLGGGTQTTSPTATMWLWRSAVWRSAAITSPMTSPWHLTFRRTVPRS